MAVGPDVPFLYADWESGEGWQESNAAPATQGATPRHRGNPGTNMPG